jgi:hypothetical protein
MEELFHAVIASLPTIGSTLSLIVALVGVISGIYTERVAHATMRKTKDILEEANENFPHTKSFRVRLNQATGEREIIESKEQSSQRSRTIDRAYTPPPPTAADLSKNQVRSRLEDVIAERERQGRSAKWANITSNTLTFGQYIVGAVLTTSLAQNTIPKAWIGGLGLVVIICSAAKQHFRPDEKAQESDRTSKRLRALVRYAQDQIVILEAKSVNGEDRTDAFIALLNEITAALNQIDTPDMSALPLKPISLEASKPGV